jgi:hypothetical protein
MQPLLIEATHKTPLVSFDGTSGMFLIQGRSIPNDSLSFWQKVIDWFTLYAKSPKPLTLFKIDLEYFNISSSKQLLSLLYKLNEVNSHKTEVKVEWIYSEDDIDMFEVGKDYAFMVNVPFEFVKRKSAEVE